MKLSASLALLVSLVCLCVMPGCRSEPLKTMDDVHAAIHKSVSDPERAATVIAITDRLAAIIDEASNETQRFEDEMRKLNIDYDATRAQFGDAMSTHDKAVKQLHDRLLANRQELVEATTTDEWGAISEIRVRSYAISSNTKTK